MEDQQASRRNFLQQLGFTAGATLLSTSVLGAFVNKEEILKLNAEQQEFMLRYGSWMDEVSEIVNLQKTDPDNMEHHKKMMMLSSKAEEFLPELNKHMKDPKFELIYHGSIQRLRGEI